MLTHCVQVPRLARVQEPRLARVQEATDGDAGRVRVYRYRQHSHHCIITRSGVQKSVCRNAEIVRLEAGWSEMPAGEWYRCTVSERLLAEQACETERRRRVLQAITACL